MHQKLYTELQAGSRQMQLRVPDRCCIILEILLR